MAAGRHGGLALASCVLGGLPGGFGGPPRWVTGLKHGGGTTWRPRVGVLCSWGSSRGGWGPPRWVTGLKHGGGTTWRPRVGVLCSWGSSRGGWGPPGWVGGPPWWVEASNMAAGRHGGLALASCVLGGPPGGVGVLQGGLGVLHGLEVLQGGLGVLQGGLGVLQGGQRASNMAVGQDGGLALASCVLGGPPSWAGGPPSWAGGPPGWVGGPPGWVGGPPRWVTGLKHGGGTTWRPRVGVLCSWGSSRGGWGPPGWVGGPPWWVEASNMAAGRHGGLALASCVLGGPPGGVGVLQGGLGVLQGG
ncbi:proteasome subunit beta type-5 isoform X5 [Gallus gallus]|uniref:proteasome subunit beta type-5 isoform X5 n=1 Tax=Gallus gallus TaxID=9031 RepID=UPI001F02FC5A|nr:proteasome subunit beta type-5 isoform X5 [Gallus gallus]